MKLPQRPVDRLISALCETIAAQREQIRALEALATSRGDDCAGFQLVARQALTALHDEQQARALLQERYERVVMEAREFRRGTKPARAQAA